MSNFFSNLLSPFTGSLAQDAADAQKAALLQGQQQGTTDLTNARNAIDTYYSRGLLPYTDLLNSANKGASGYADALGLNGPEGNARATAGFWNNPGTQAAIDAGSENIVRKSNAAGGGPLNGATLAALQKFGNDTVSQNWTNYVNQLNPYLNQQTQAAGGVSNVNVGQGNAVAGNYGQQAGLDYSTNAGIGNAQANADLATQQGIGNLYGLGLNTIKAFAGGGMPKIG